MKALKLYAAIFVVAIVAACAQIGAPQPENVQQSIAYGYSSVASVFKVDAVSGVAVSGLVYSGNEHVTVTYSLQNPTALTPTRDIHIHGE